MRKLTLAALLGASLVSASALAVPLLPANSPIYFQYNNAEQFSASNAITSGGTNEGLWGLAQLSTMSVGLALSPSGSDIGSNLSPFFVQGQNGGEQITAIFYGLTSKGPGSPALLTGGYMDLWYSVNSSLSVTSELTTNNIATKRTSQACYTGFACDAGSTFLARLVFSPGINASASGGADLTSTDAATLQPGTGDGVAKSYLDVDLSAGGLWAAALDKNYFTLDANNVPWTTFGLGAKDVRLDTNFTINGASAWSVAGTDIVGLRTNDPGRAYTVPEPGSLSLIGAALFAFGAWRRRRDSKA